MKNSFLITFRSLIWITILTFMFASCIPQKKMLYLQVHDEADTLSSFNNERKIDYRVQPGDNLYIRVVSLDEQTTLLLNPLSGGSSNYIGQSDASIYLTSYTVSEDGNLDFPMTGEVFVKNMSIDEVKTSIQEKLRVYLKEFVVIVKLVNYNITLLGEVSRPGQYKVYQDNINLFEAVSMSGDLTDYANRNKIAIIRQNKTGSEVVYVDLTKRDILLSDYYYLKPNDIVYVQPVKGKQFTFAEFPYAILFGFISSTILIINFVK
ncbi:MAG: polysaccharide biosynthesis/export family protein [Bacteroidetes bacterium]|nr:polysaccharide biosynthesis/export family protein [Bacteroidota bacterium]